RAGGGRGAGSISGGGTGLAHRIGKSVLASAEVPRAVGKGGSGNGAGDQRGPVADAVLIDEHAVAGEGQRGWRGNDGGNREHAFIRQRGVLRSARRAHRGGAIGATLIR